MNTFSLLHEFLSHLLIAREETTVPREEPQGSVRRFVTDHEIRHGPVIIQISSTDRTLELNPQSCLAPLCDSMAPYAYKETLDEKLVMPDEKIVIKTKHGELSLEQLAEAQHGMAHLMKEVGERYHVLYYAAKALNWKLAQYQLNQVIALFRIGATLRPKFTEDLNEFVKTHFHPMSEAIRAQDWRRFEEAFKKGIRASDQFHEKYGYGYIHFVLPTNPPEMYDLTPRD